MARKPSDGNLQLHFVGSISNQAAPTAAEITGGTNLTSFLRPDGLSLSLSGNRVDAADVSSKFNATSGGSYGSDGSATFYRNMDSAGGYATDTAWDTLPIGTTGFLVVARNGGSNSGAIQATDEVEVWPIEVVTRAVQDIGRDKNTMFDVDLAVTSAPNLDSVVA